MNDVLAGLIKGLAPTVASALLGPLGGVAVAAIGKIVGIDGATTAQISQAFQDGKITPDHLAEIKKLELQYQNDEKERQFKYVDLEFQDTKSARDMQIATNSQIPAILTIIITVGFFGILAWMMHNPSVKDSAPLMVMLGQLSAGWAACVGFWFGSSHGSQNKDVLLANAPSPK